MKEEGKMSMPSEPGKGAQVLVTDKPVDPQ